MGARQTGEVAWPRSRALHSGALDATFDEGAIANLSMRGHELVRLLYVAVRDPAWNTIRAVPVSVQLHDEASTFVVEVWARATSTSLDLEWHLKATGFPDGTLHVNFRAQALRNCAFARIGLCLHFDAEDFKQAQYEASNDTVSWTGRFPGRIHPQYLVDGLHHPCIAPFSSMRIALRPDAGLDIRLEGDQFEMEDQRNWTDATFKAYTTPLALGELHHLRAGDTIQQKLQVALRAPAHPPMPREHPVLATALTPLPRYLPRLGAALFRTGSPPVDPSIGFSHWRLDVRSEADVDPVLNHIQDIHAGKGIELVLHHDAISDHVLEKLLADSLITSTLTRLILLGESESLPSPARVLAIMARTKSIMKNLSVGAGAPEAYADLARDRDDFADVDFVAFPISPQSHVFDTPSIFETLPVQEQVVRQARQRTSRAQVVISPLTFGLQHDPSQADDALPHRDPRIDHVGAAWLASSFGHLALGGAASVSIAPDLWMTKNHQTAFRNLLTILVGLDGARLRPFQIDDPRRAFVFGATRDDATVVFLINPTARLQTVCLAGLNDGNLTEPHETRASGVQPAPLKVGHKTGTTLELHPYQIRILHHRSA